MEDLSGFGKDRDGNADEKKEFVLRNWSYYELQNMINYKAAKYGIKVEKIRPAYTSKTCSWCGHQGFREGITFICENVLQQLPSTFTIDDLRRLKGSECADGTLYSILSRWKAEGWIEKVDKINWKKA